MVLLMMSRNLNLWQKCPLCAIILASLIWWEGISIFCVIAGRKTKKNMSHFSDVFNSVIHLLGLREISMSGGCYTWSNKQENPTLQKSDRVMMSSDWEDLYPLVSVHKMVNDNSDHNPLLLDGGWHHLGHQRIGALSLIMPG